MSADPKICALRLYLESAFPGYTVSESTARKSEISFKIHGHDGYYQVSVKLTFLETHAVDEIAVLLQEWKVAVAVRTATTACVIVGNGGVSVAWA